jgi:hypothetical protein
MSSPLWLSIEPCPEEVRLMLSEPGAGTVLKARLRTPPAHPRALGMLLEALSTWYHCPLHAVLDADAPAVQSSPELWARLTAEDLGLEVRVEWVARPMTGRRRDGFLSPMGDFTSARRLINNAGTGQP